MSLDAADRNVCATSFRRSDLRWIGVVEIQAKSLEMGVAQMKPPGSDANESVAHRIDLRLYGLAVLSVAVALSVALFLQHLGFRDGASPLLLFAVAIASWYGGRGPAALAV